MAFSFFNNNQRQAAEQRNPEPDLDSIICVMHSPVLTTNGFIRGNDIVVTTNGVYTPTLEQWPYRCPPEAEQFLYRPRKINHPPAIQTPANEHPEPNFVPSTSTVHNSPVNVDNTAIAEVESPRKYYLRPRQQDTAMKKATTSYQKRKTRTAKVKIEAVETESVNGTSCTVRAEATAVHKYNLRSRPAQPQKVVKNKTVRKLRAVKAELKNVKIEPAS